MDEIQTFTLQAGTLCKRNGIPFILMEDVLIGCHPNNWPLIRDDLTRGVIEAPSTGDDDSGEKS